MVTGTTHNSPPLTDSALFCLTPSVNPVNFSRRLADRNKGKHFTSCAARPAGLARALLNQVCDQSAMSVVRARGPGTNLAPRLCRGKKDYEDNAPVAVSWFGRSRF